MVATFLFPVATALWVFPIIALVIMLPVAVVSYRRRGRAGGWTTLVFYSFLFYLIAAFLQTIIPLPRDGSYCTGHTYASSPQLRPFYFVEVISQRARGHWNLSAIMHNAALWSTALNVVLLVPLGMFLRYLSRLGIVATTAIGFGVALFFELTQLTGLWFIYPCAYRLFSVDDLMLNTLGVPIGWLIGSALRRVLPDLAPARDLRRYADKVTVTRRLFAFAADLIGFAALLGFVFGLLILFGLPTSGQGLPVLTIALVWFVLVPSITGSTSGKRAMLLRIERTNGRPAGPLALLVRYGILLSPLWLLWLALSVDIWDIVGHPERLLILLGILLSGFVVGVWTPLAVFFSDDRRAPYEQLTRTINVAILRGRKPAG